MRDPPDLVLCGRAVFDAPGDAVALSAGRIVAVGARRDVLALRGRRTRVIVSEDALLCPAFHDAHAHLGLLADAERELDVHGATALEGTPNGLDSLLRAALAEAPANAWIVGRGLDPELFPADGPAPRDVLDRLAPGRAVVLRTHDEHAAVLSSAALHAAGFDGTPPRTVAGGVTDTDTAGRPTGFLRENAALAALRAVPKATEAERADGIERAARRLARAGIAAVHEMSGSRDLRLLRALRAAGRLPIDVHATVSPSDVEDADLRAPFEDGGTVFRVAGMKAFLDGALGSRTARLLAPYEGETCHCGVEVLPRDGPDGAAAAVRRAAASGLPSFLHAIGDAAVRTALDVLSATPLDDAGTHASRGLHETPRHRVEHAQMVHPEDVPRFAAHGIVASVQPVHLALDAPLVRRHWGARADRAFPLRRLLDAGAILAFGSDAPVETADLAESLRCALTRRARDGSVLHPESAITLDEAVRAYTTDAFRAAGLATSRADAPVLRPGAPASVLALAGESPDELRVAAVVLRGAVLFSPEDGTCDPREAP